MIAILLIWLVGAAAMVYEITARHLWNDVLSAMLGAGFILWCFGGAALISMRQGKRIPQAQPRFTPEQSQRVADIARAAQRQPSEAAK